MRETIREILDGFSAHCGARGFMFFHVTVSAQCGMLAVSLTLAHFILCDVRRITECASVVDGTMRVLSRVRSFVLVGNFVVIIE